MSKPSSPVMASTAYWPPPHRVVVIQVSIYYTVFCTKIWLIYFVLVFDFLTILNFCRNAVAPRKRYSRRNANHARAFLITEVTNAQKFHNLSTWIDLAGIFERSIFIGYYSIWSFGFSDIRTYISSSPNILTKYLVTLLVFNGKNDVRRQFVTEDNYNSKASE